MALNEFNRRTFLRVGALSAWGSMHLGDALRLQAAEPSPADVSVILLWCAGGMSQFETWDPKPEADEKYRGLFKPIPTNADGIFIGEHLPLSARQADKYVIIRSMTGKDAVHETAQAFSLSGHAPLPGLNYPSMGSIVSHELTPRNELPSYIITGGGASFWEQAAFLGPRHNPFSAGNPNTPNYRVRDLDLPMGVDWARVERRKSLLTVADNYFRQFDTIQAVDKMSTHYQTALSLIRSERARKAFDIASEPEKLRERYGRTAMGQGCLLARRLVESGVRLVSVRSGNWDHHQEVFRNLSRDNLPEFDRAFAGLLEDLTERGMMSKTLVIAATEFGRTPEINVNAGRDHWPNAYSIVMAGGGIRGGRVIGKTDRNCQAVAERRVHVEEILATVYHKLGVDYRKVFTTSIGRPVRVVDEPFEPVSELLA
ncbi:MAG: DUF1501 domain-containing protein [Bryobacteraceae bacterium]